MPSNGKSTDGKFSEDLLRGLKKSLEHLESLLLHSDQEAASINRLKKQIRAKIVEIESAEAG
jgi:hypothetical protein